MILKKLKRRVTKTLEYGWFDESPKNDGRSETVLQRTEDGISVDSKKFTGEEIEMVSR